MSTRLSTSPEPLRLELKASRYLCAALIGLALCGFAAIAYSAIDWRWQLACSVLLLAHLGLLLRRHAQPPGSLIWRDNIWLWIDRDQVERVLCLRHATLWPGFIVLRLRDENTGKSRVFTLLKDSLDSVGQRRLRMHVRHMPVFAERESSA